MREEDLTADDADQTDQNADLQNSIQVGFDRRSLPVREVDFDSACGSCFYD